jgi:uncharacterized membrane protein
MPPKLLAVPRSVELTRPLQWLVRGAQDLARCPGVSLAHGLAMALAGGVLLWLLDNRFWLAAGSVSGFLLVAPILGTGLYALSRALERGQPANLSVVLHTWLNWQGQRIKPWGAQHWRLLRFGVLLAASGTTWVLTSAGLITLMTPFEIKTVQDFLRHVVLAPSGYLFELWVVLGGVLVAPIFASTVVTIPLLLDRQMNIKEAVLTSWLVVLANPVPMALWAGLLMLLTLLGFALALVGLVVVMPVLGHASWHAYRDLLDTSALPAQEAQ